MHEIEDGGAKSPEAPVPAAPQAAPTTRSTTSRSTTSGATTPLIQAKLTVGAAGDRFEREADQVAAAVMRDIQRSDLEQTKVQPASGESPVVHRAIAASPSTSGRVRAIGKVSAAPTEQAAPRVQLKAGAPTVGLAGGDVDTDTDSKIRQAAGGGSSLDEPLRRSMENSFGADFSQVNIHADSRANELSERIQAKAFTTGNDVFFRSGEYQPSTTAGQELIAHELTHVVQQGGATTQRRVQREIGDLGQGAAKQKATAYPSAGQAREYMDALPGVKAGNQWRELKKIAAGRNLSDSITLLAHYCWGLAQETPKDPAELPAFKQRQETWKAYMKPAAEKIGIVLKQKNLYAFRTGAETDIKKNRELVTKGGTAEAKNFYFWSMTQSYADEEAAQQQGTTLEASAAGSMWVNRAFADPDDGWCGAPGRLDRIIFEAMSGPYAATAGEVIKGNKSVDAGDNSVIKILQYRGINHDTAFYQEEWAKVKASGLPYQFAVYLFSGSPTPAGWPAGGVFVNSQFKDVKLYDKGLSEHYVKQVGSKGSEVPPEWDFKDKSDPFLRYGGVHVDGKGAAEPGHDRPTRAFAEIPAAFLGNQMVGKDPATGAIHLMNLDGSKGAFYAADEDAAIALANGGSGTP